MGEGDTIESHLADTIAAGAGTVDEDIAQSMGLPKDRLMVTIYQDDDEAIEVVVHGRPRRIALADVASARTVVDWAAELKGRSA